MIYQNLLENLSHDNRDRPLIVASLKSIETRLVNEVLAIVETTVWPRSEYSSHVTRLNETLNTLEKELLSQYQSNRLTSTNLSIEEVKKRFENFNISFHNKYDSYLNHIKSDHLLYDYMNHSSSYGFRYFVDLETKSIQKQIHYIKNLPHFDN